MKIMVLHGPNLNLLGSRLPERYGTLSLTELEKQIANFALAELADVQPYFFQTNHEGQLIDFIQKAELNYAGIVYNPAAHAYYSLALRDAVQAAAIPLVEVQLSGSLAPTEPPTTSLISAVALAHFVGEGAAPYLQALRFLVEHIRSQERL